MGPSTNLLSGAASAARTTIAFAALAELSLQLEGMGGLLSLKDLGNALGNGLVLKRGGVPE
jgi:hypothetical protein